MDGFNSHDKSLDELEPMVNHFQVRILKIPEHSSNQVQPLDIVGFNLQKNRTKTFNVIPFYTLPSNRILAILHGLYFKKTNISLMNLLKQPTPFKKMELNSIS